MKKLLNRLFEHDTFSAAEARAILIDIASGRYNDAQMTAFISAFCMRTITLQELIGFREAMLELCLRVDLSPYQAIDLCGTGGDGKQTFNISTLSSFILAGAAYPVAKHGNYGVSSLSGSSNVMEYLGYKFTNSPEQLQESIEKASICFLHAPLFHPAMKTVAAIRKELGVKTFFNMLGPLVNPSSPQFQLVGVYSLELARLYYHLYQQIGVSFMILHSLDGYDEISLTSDLKVYSNKGEGLFKCESLISESICPEQIAGGNTLKESASIFQAILEGRGTPAQNAVVCWNAAFAIQCIHAAKPLDDCFQEAKESLVSGRALSCLKTLFEVNRSAAEYVRKF